MGSNGGNCALEAISDHHYSLEFPVYQGDAVGQCTMCASGQTSDQHLDIIEIQGRIDGRCGGLVYSVGNGRVCAGCLVVGGGRLLRGLALIFGDAKPRDAKGQQ